MKKLILIICALAIIAGCKKSEDEPKTGRYTFSCYIQDRLSTGEIIEKSKDIAVLHIWDANGRDFDTSNFGDAISGYMFDKIEGKSVQSIETKMYLSSAYGELPVGRYLIYINIGNEYPNFAYSYKVFDIVGGEVTNLKKVFHLGIYPTSYDPW